jgi:hypothetical protein
MAADTHLPLFIVFASRINQRTLNRMKTAWADVFDRTDTAENLRDRPRPPKVTYPDGKANSEQTAPLFPSP